MERRFAAPARVALAFSALAALIACGDSGTGPGGEVSIRVTPELDLLTADRSERTLTATVTGGSGTVSWSSADPSVATVNAAGQVSAVASGSTRITAALTSGASASARIEVWLPDPVASYTPGQLYRGRAGYVDYIPGELPLVLAAGHGGDLEPDSEIPDRTSGTTVQDRNTISLTDLMADALEAETGLRPHVIISNLHRRKLDPNRAIGEAAQGNVFAELAWAEFHDFIEVASDRVATDFGRGLFLDIHGHGHPIARVELGYLMSSSQLGLSDAGLDGLAGSTSVREVVERTGVAASTLLRGAAGLGTRMDDAGIPSVPSQTTPDPGNDPYFSGGYSTARHGSRDGGTVSAIQLEHHFPGLRDTRSNREAYAAAMAPLLVEYLSTYFGYTAPAPTMAGRSGRSPTSTAPAGRP